MRVTTHMSKDLDKKFEFSLPAQEIKIIKVVAVLVLILNTTLSSFLGYFNFAWM